MSKPLARKLTLLAAVAVVMAGCDDRAPLTAPDRTASVGGASTDVSPVRAEELRVLTWNVYVGGDLESAFLAPAAVPFPVLVTGLWGQILSTRFEERAVAIADQIVEGDPHVVALQEVSEFRIQSPGDFLAGVPLPNAPPGDVRLDFLDVLLAALEDRGAAYRPALVSENFDIEVPMVTPSGDFDDIRLLDHDVLLVREDVRVHEARSVEFGTSFELGPPAFPVELSITRGFGVAELTIGRRDYRVAVTHLEPPEEGGESVQTAQARQLLAALDDEIPTVLVGDFNSGPHPGSTTTYGTLLDAGFADTWTSGRPRGEGPTCCRAPDLRAPGPGLDRRVDIVFYRDALTLEGAPFRGRVRTVRVGEAPEDRTASGLWPSDHAGVLASLKPAPMPGGLGRGEGSPRRER